VQKSFTGENRSREHSSSGPSFSPPTTIRSIGPADCTKTVRDLPIISPHGHTDARWFAENQPFPDPTASSTFPIITCFACSTARGIAMEDLGIGKKELERR